MLAGLLAMDVKLWQDSHCYMVITSSQSQIISDTCVFLLMIALRQLLIKWISCEASCSSTSLAVAQTLSAAVKKNHAPCTMHLKQ